LLTCENGRSYDANKVEVSQHWNRKTLANSNKNRYDEDGIKKQLEEEEREIEEAEKYQITPEFSTNIIAAHTYCLRNVIHADQGFDCEIIYIPRHRDPQDDRYLSKRFAVRLISKNTIIECTEIRDGWSGYGQLWSGEQHIDQERAQELIKQAMAIAAALIDIPESEVEQDRFFCRTRGDRGGGRRT
jgi:hypothetical protein